MLWDVLVSEPDPPRARGSGSETRDVRTRVHVHYLNDDVIALAAILMMTSLLLRNGCESVHVEDWAAAALPQNLSKQEGTH